MADTKISDFTDGGVGLATDDHVVNRAGTDVKVRVMGSDGWTVADAMTYASGSGGGPATMTCSGDQTAKYTPGTRIKLTQTTDKYFVVTAVSFASSTTTITITAGSDYTLANATITSPYYSYAANPQGYPGTFNYTTNATGFSSKSSDTGKFSVNGRTVTVYSGIVGTSNATTFTCDAPIAAASASGLPVLATNNGATILARALISGSTITFGVSTGSSPTALNGSGGFTNSGTKGANAGVIAIYQI